MSYFCAEVNISPKKKTEIFSQLYKLRATNCLRMLARRVLRQTSPKLLQRSISTTLIKKNEGVVQL